MDSLASTFKGLASADIAAYQAKYGLNVFVEEQHQSAWGTFLEEFKSPLIIMLLVAAGISFLFNSWISGTLIIIIVMVSAIIDFWISYKSQKAVQLLTQKITPRTLVVRDGKEMHVDIEQIVPEDIVILEAGDIVPADGVVLDEKDFFVNESSLTGESLPIEKSVSAEVFLGSGVVTGRAYIQVKATGKHTTFYGIVALLTQRERPTEFERGVKDFSVLVARVVIVMTLLVFLINATLKHDILNSLIFSLAIAVGIIPELLPAIIAVNVSKASILMAKNGVIIKKLSAIENFGCMNILCTDKTGTLTEDRISVVRYITIDGIDSTDVLKYGYMSSSFHTGTKSPLDDAIAHFKDFDITDVAKIDEIPFDFERRRESVVVKENGQTFMVTKGAPECVFSASTLSPEDIKKADDLFESLSSDGYRVIAIATKNTPGDMTRFVPADEKELTFQGFIAFIDPPKKDVKEVLDELKRKNIEIKIITGDHRKVAEKIAKEVGLVSKGVLEAAEIDALSDEELAVRSVAATLFTRVTPAQKNRIIQALQSKGNTVGYMGDGINDAPALRMADIGISVDNAVDVAKDAADIILLNKSLGQLVGGVTEGRRTFANTVKYITMAVSSNFGNMFSMIGASLFLPFLPMLPTQILLNNLLYEGSQFATTVDTVDEEILNQPNPWDILFIKKFMIVFGIMSSVFDFATFYVLYKVFSLSGSGFQTGWFIESFATQTLIVFFVRTHRSIFKATKPHTSVVISAFGAVAVAWILALTPLGAVFGFTSLSGVIVMYIVVIAAVYFVAVEITKHFFYKATTSIGVSKMAHTTTTG